MGCWRIGGGDFDVIAIGLQESSYREKNPDSDDQDPTTAELGATIDDDRSENEDGDVGSNTFGSIASADLASPTSTGDDVLSEDEREDILAVLNSDGDDAAVHDIESEAVTVEESGNSSPSHDRSGSFKLKRAMLAKSISTKSIKQMGKVVRKMSNNFRETVADALDYPFLKQLYVRRRKPLFSQFVCSSC